MAEDLNLLTPQFAQRRALFVTKIDAIEVDSCLDETHTFDNTVTDHPVEEGFDISDHSRPNADVVNLRCFVSNTPLSAAQMTRAVRSGSFQFRTTSTAPAELSVTGISGRGQDTYNKLQQLRVEGTLVEVVTTLRTYVKTSTTGMIVQSLSVPRTRQNYDGIEFNVSLKQIRIVKNKSAINTQKDVRTRKKKDEGAKTATEAQPKGSHLDEGYKNGDGSFGDTIKGALKDVVGVK